MFEGFKCSIAWCEKQATRRFYDGFNVFNYCQDHGAYQEKRRDWNKIEKIW